MLLIAGLALSLMSFKYQSKGDDIINALKQANVTQFSSFFDNFIDIKIPEKDEARNVDKTQAGITMRSFFEQNGIKGFDLTSQRAMGGTMYMTGKLEGEKNYNLTLMMKDKGDKLAIITIRIN